MSDRIAAPCARRPILLALGFLAVASLARAEELTRGRVIIRSTLERRATSERLAELLEKEIPFIEEQLGIKASSDKKLVLNLYATEEQYAAAVKANGAPSLVRNLAGTADSTFESYLLLQPRTDAAYLDLVHDLPELTAFLACHEAVHQWTRRAGIANVRSWPGWYSQGMAATIAERYLRARTKSAECVYVEDDESRVKDALLDGWLDSPANLVHEDVRRVANRHFVHSEDHCFYRFLAADPSKLHHLHQLVRAIGSWSASDEKGQARFDESVENALVRTYGPLESLEPGWREYVKHMTPRWLEYGRSVERVGDELVCASFPGDSNSILISTSPPPEGGFTLSGEVETLAIGSTQQAEIYFAHESPGNRCKFLKMALGSEGYATLLGFSDGKWQDDLRVNVHVPAETFAPGRWIAFKLAVDAGGVRLDVDGKRILETPVPTGFNAAGGRYGLGCLDGVARFRKIKAEKLGKPGAPPRR